MGAIITSITVTILVILVIGVLIWWVAKKQIPKVLPSQLSAAVGRLVNSVNSPQCEVLCSRINNIQARRNCINRCLDRQFRALCRADCDNDNIEDRAQCYYNCDNASL